MIRHVVTWRLKDFAALTPQTATWLALQKSIAAMRSGVPGLRQIELALDESRSPDSDDVILYSEFESWAALESYQVHPLHEDFKKLFGPLRTARRVVDYEF